MSNNRGGSRRPPGQYRAQTGGGGIASYQPNPAATGPNTPFNALMNPSVIQNTGGGAYHNQHQQSRRPALLSQPMPPQTLTLPTQIQSVPTVPTTQRQHLQQRYQTGQVGQPPAGAIYNPHTHMTITPQQAAMAAAFQSQLYQPYQAQTIYSGAPGPMPPMYPAAATLRGQHHQQYGGVGAVQQVQPRTSYQHQKRPTKAVRIVDADTKEALDVEKLKSGGTGTTVATPATSSGSQTDATKRTIFREQMQEIQSSDVVKPNAIISDTASDTIKQEIHTKQSKPAPPTKAVTITDPLVSDKPVTASETKPVEQVTPPEPQEPVKPVVDVKSDVSILPQPVKPVISSEAPPTPPVSSTSEVSVKEEMVSVSEDKKDKMEEEKSDAVLPTSDRSVTGLKSDSSTSIDSQRQPVAIAPVTTTTTSSSTAVNTVNTVNVISSSIGNKGAGLLATPTNIPAEILNTSTCSNKLNSSASSIASNGSHTSDKTSSDVKDQESDRERVQTEEGDKEDPPVDEEEEELDELMSMTADRPLPAATTPSTTSTTSTGPAVAKDGLLDIPNGHDKDSLGFLKDSQGRFVYKREFLLQYSILSLPPPDAIRDTIDIFTSQKGNRGLELLKKGTTASHGSRGSSRVVITHNPNKAEKVELRKAEQRWTRQAARGDPAGADNIDPATEELFRKFQGILNKLTPQKFKNLAENARELEINTEERLKGCIDKIFSKALEEPNFSVAYAHLCRVLSFIKVEIVKVDESGEEIVKETTFRRELLTRCQKEFEKDKRDDETKEEMLKALEEAAPEEKKLKEAELKEWENKSRKRSLGNIRFIGELFKLKMLSESIMHECIVRLLRSTSDEEALECFSRLITTTGKELDHPQAKQRMDRYFDRINEIIDKKKISSRIRFMLQDVQEMRKNDWVSRRQETLKTIDQIHQEAEMEAMQEKEMIRSLQPVSGKQYSRDDKKRSKGDDYSGSRKGDKTTGGRRDSTPDVSRIQALGNKKEKTTPTLGPASLRPGGWKGGRSQGQTPPPPASTSIDVKDKGTAGKGPQRSSSSSTSKKSSATTTTAGGRGLQPQATRRSQSDERSDALKLVKEFTNPQAPPASQATPTHTTSKQDKLTEEVVERKTTTIIDELSQNQDYKEAVECVIELESPGLMNVFVQTGINHSLEKSSTVRVSVGKLFDTLVTKDLLTTENLISGLQMMLECGEDLEVDIPKVWDFFAEIVAPLVSSSNLPLNSYIKLLRDINVEKRKLSRNVARTLKYCIDHCSSKERVCQLWRGCGLKWTEVGVPADDVVGFLKDEGVSFLNESAPAADSSGSEVHPPDKPPYLQDLSLLFGSTVHTNDDILDWIEKKVSRSESKSELFIRTLSRATVCGSTTGEGQSTIYNDDIFAKRLPLLKKWVDQEEELQGVVLDGIQFEVHLLRHPPGLLHKMFSSLYSIEVISESAFLNWKDRGKEKSGRGMALQSSKKFFNWLEHAETESDNDVGS